MFWADGSQGYEAGGFEGGVSGGWKHGDLSGTDVLSGRCK